VALLDTIVLVGLMLQNPAALDPQGPPAAPAGSRDPSLDRIRSRLEKAAVVAEPADTTQPGRRPAFQIRIESPHLPAWDWLDTGTSIPGYVRPTVPPAHHEFLLAGTPEDFRGASHIPSACRS
jgi:hypothetical protein